MSGVDGARLAGAALTLTLGVVLAGCGAVASTVPVPTTAPSAAPILSDAVSVAAVQVQDALRAGGLTATMASVPYRPGESPALAAAPRLVLKAVLPDDEAHGFIVLYDYPTAALAYSAGMEMAAYLASGPGRIQFPPDAEQVIRQLGSTLVFYSWSKANSPEPAAADVATALDTLGLGIPIVR
jgi:hypothetical protein